MGVWEWRLLEANRVEEIKFSLISERSSNIHSYPIWKKINLSDGLILYYYNYLMKIWLFLKNMLMVEKNNVS